MVRVLEKLAYGFPLTAALSPRRGRRRIFDVLVYSVFCLEFEVL
jgi:hypothetical protein